MTSRIKNLLYVKEQIMAVKSFEEKLNEREAAIRQQWAAQSKAKKVTATADLPSADDSPTAVKREMEHELSLLKMMANEQIPTGVRSMTETDYAGLLERIKEAFARHGIPSENIWLQLSSPKWWAVSLFLPYKGLAVKKINSTVQKILADDIGVDVSCADYFGKNPKFQAHEWYFMPPEIPKDIKRCIDVAGEFGMQAEANTELGMGIPVPKRAKNTGRVPVIVLPEELYRRIESGEKTVEYRNLVSYYCDLFFDTGKMEKAVKFQLGYSGKDGGKPERMAWEITDIMLVSERGKLAPAMTNGKMSTFKNLPCPFAPVAYAIKLGNRLDISHLPDDKLQFETVEAISVSPDESRVLVDDIKAGRLKSKSPDGYLVLKAQFYDAIEVGTKKVEYRDFTEYNLKRTIGIKTVRFNRGYVKNASQMRLEVEKIVLLDGDDNECDPFNVPDGFWPMTIAIHLGKRIM